MKTLFIILSAAVSLASCATYTETKPDGSKVRLLTMGTNANHIEAGSFKADMMNQSEAVEHGAETIQAATRLKGWFSLGNTAVSELGNAADQLIK